VNFGPLGKLLLDELARAASALVGDGLEALTHHASEAFPECEKCGTRSWMPRQTPGGVVFYCARCEQTRIANEASHVPEAHKRR
jgi:hypothetical protein